MIRAMVLCRCLSNVLTDVSLTSPEQYINLPMIAIGMIVCVFALPLKAVKGDIKSKLKKIDYGGSALTLAWAVLILLPLSWYVRRSIS
jgi:hypothetical protein